MSQTMNKVLVVFDATMCIASFVWVVQKFAGYLFRDPATSTFHALCWIGIMSLLCVPCVLHYIEKAVEYVMKGRAA